MSSSRRHSRQSNYTDKECKSWIYCGLYDCNTICRKYLFKLQWLICLGNLEAGSWETLPTLRFHGPLVKRGKCTSAQLNRCRPWYKSGVAAALLSLKFLSFRYVTNYAGRTSEFGCSSSMSPSTLNLFFSSAASTAGKIGVKCSKGDTSHIYIYIIYMMQFTLMFDFIHIHVHIFLVLSILPVRLRKQRRRDGGWNVLLRNSQALNHVVLSHKRELSNLRCTTKWCRVKCRRVGARVLWFHGMLDAAMCCSALRIDHTWGLWGTKESEHWQTQCCTQITLACPTIILGILFGRFWIWRFEIFEERGLQRYKRCRRGWLQGCATCRDEGWFEACHSPSKFTPSNFNQSKSSEGVSLFDFLNLEAFQMLTFRPPLGLWNAFCFRIQYHSWPLNPSVWTCISLEQQFRCIFQLFENYDYDSWPQDCIMLTFHFTLQF